MMIYLIYKTEKRLVYLSAVCIQLLIGCSQSSFWSWLNMNLNSKSEKTANIKFVWYKLIIRMVSYKKQSMFETLSSFPEFFIIRSISHDPDKPRAVMTTRGPIVVSFCASNRAITRDERSYEFLTRRPPILFVIRNRDDDFRNSWRKYDMQIRINAFVRIVREMLRKKRGFAPRVLFSM